MSGAETDLTHLARRVRAETLGSRGAVVAGPIGSGVSTTLLHVCTLEREQGGRALHLTSGGFTEVLGRLLPDALDTMARLTPTLVAVDDGQLLDASAAELLVALVLNTDTRFVVGLHHGGEAGELVAALATMAALTEFSLAPLPPPLVGALCASILHGRVHTGTVNEISRRTAGWPGLVADLVRHAHEAGSLRETSGMFRFVSDPGLADATIRRVAAMRRTWDDACRATIERLALADGLEGRLADLPPGVRTSGLVHEVAGMIRLATPAVAQAVVTTTPSARLTHIADELLATEGNRDEPLKVRWQLAAGRTPPGREIANAARAAHAAGDVWRAVSMLALAGEAGDTSTETVLMRADLAQETGDWALGAALLSQLVADPNLEPVHRGLVVAQLANAKLWDLNEADEAIAIAKVMHEMVVGTAWEPTASSVLGAVLVYNGRARDSLSLLLPALEHKAHPSMIAAASTSLVLNGQCSRGAEAADRAMEVRLRFHQQVGVPSLEVYANAQMMAYSELGDLDRAMEIAADLLHDHSATGLRTGWLAIARARVLLMRGELDEARRACDEAAVMFADLNRHATLRWAHAGQALVAAYQGRVGDAGDALATLDRVGPSAVGFLESDVQRARAFHAAAAGDLPGARGILRDAAERAEDLGNLVLAASAWHDLARVGSPAEAAEALTRILPSIDSRWNAPRLLHATALTRRDAAGTLEAAVQFATMGAMLCALEAAAQAHAIARAEGQRPIVQKATAATLAYAERCPGAHTPAMRDAATIQLTPREREVAELVAGGRTSRETANTLGVSVRTVENLLQRVYTKLGIQDRASLVDVLSGA